jgi:hypothetical protein
MTEAGMLDLLTEDNGFPDIVEEVAWEGRAGFLPDLPVMPIEEFSGKVMQFHGGATEMVPSLVDRGGWQLVLRRSERRYLNIHQAALNINKFSNHVSHFVLNDQIQGPPAGDASGLARALLSLAGSPTIKEIAAGSRLDPVSIGAMVRAVYSLLTTVDTSSSSLPGGLGAAESSNFSFVPEPPTSDAALLNSSTDSPDSKQILADADRLAEEFLSVPDLVSADPDVLLAVEALMERYEERRPEDIHAWADELSEILSRFTD